MEAARIYTQQLLRKYTVTQGIKVAVYGWRATLRTQGTEWTESAGDIAAIGKMRITKDKIGIAMARHEALHIRKWFVSTRQISILDMTEFRPDGMYWKDGRHHRAARDGYRMS